MHNYVSCCFGFLDSKPFRTFKCYKVLHHEYSYMYVHAAMVGGVMLCRVYASVFTFWILLLTCTFSTVVLLDIKC